MVSSRLLGCDFPCPGTLKCVFEQTPFGVRDTYNELSPVACMTSTQRYRAFSIY